MTRTAVAAVACAIAGWLLTGCGGDDAETSAEPTHTPATSEAPSYDPPGGKVVYDLRVPDEHEHPAVEAYATWQRASTIALRERAMSDAVTEHAADGPLGVVERSLETVRERDYVVPRRMVGRVDSVRASGRAAVVRVCLWSPTFDYHERRSGESAATSEPRWLGAEVRMTRETGQDGGWIVAGLAPRADCEGSKP